MARSELALLAGGTAKEAADWTFWRRMESEHPLFFDPHFQIPSREQEDPTHELQADRLRGDRRREPARRWRSHSGRRPSP